MVIATRKRSHHALHHIISYDTINHTRNNSIIYTTIQKNIRIFITPSQFNFDLLLLINLSSL